MGPGARDCISVRKPRVLQICEQWDESRVVLSEYYEGIVINGKYICYGHIQYDGGPTCVFSFYSIIKTPGSQP